MILENPEGGREVQTHVHTDQFPILLVRNIFEFNMIEEGDDVGHYQHKACSFICSFLMGEGF